MAFSRVFLVLALVAMMMVGAFADRALLNKSTDKSATKADKSAYKAAKSLSKACKKAFGNTCAACEYNDDSTAVICTECASGFQFNEDGDACICEDGTGTITKAQIKAYYKANKGSKTKHYGKYTKCVDCAAWGLEADAGVCVEPLQG